MGDPIPSDWPAFLSGDCYPVRPMPDGRVYSVAFLQGPYGQEIVLPLAIARDAIPFAADFDDQLSGFSLGKAFKFKGFKTKLNTKGLTRGLSSTARSISRGASSLGRTVSRGVSSIAQGAGGLASSVLDTIAPPPPMEDPNAAEMPPDAMQYEDPMTEQYPDQMAPPDQYGSAYPGDFDPASEAF